MNGWANTDPMQPDPFDPSLYVYDIDIFEMPGETINWKFRALPAASFVDGGWEGGDAHPLVMPDEDTVLDPMKPNILPQGAPLSQDVTVRFSVDVNDALDCYNGLPFADPIRSVWVTGDWNNWGGAWGVADTATLVRLYDDGATKGDATAADGIWSTEVLFSTGDASTRLYKYSIYAAGVDTLNGGTECMDNEAGFSMNHVIIVDDSSPTMILDLDYFGSQWREDIGIKLLDDETIPKEFAISQNYPNPFNPTTSIKYAVPKESRVKLTIYNTMGQKVETLVNTKQSPGTYMATWNGRDQYGNRVTTGIYFYRIEAGDFVSTNKMMFIK